MFKYWTFWNFSWYFMSELKLVPFSGPLMTSIVNTSLIGGFMTYVYPRKVVIKIGDKKYSLPYYQIILLDIFFHQLPLIRFWQKKPERGLCGLYSIIPVFGWFCLNEYRKIDHDRIYNIKFIKLFASSMAITGYYGILKHLKLWDKIIDNKK